MSENKSPKKLEGGQGNTVAPVPQPPPGQSWVQFDEASENKDSPAVITTESVQINLERSISKSGDGNNVAVLDPKPLRNVELPIATVEPMRQGFSNGDIIVTLLPVNTRFPWITPAQFRPELVPEELMAQGLTLTVEEYVQAMELLVNDVRFSLYNVCYKRILVVWITLAFLILLGLLFSGLTGLTLFGLGIGWLILNAGAIFLSMYLKFRLQRNLERCLAHVNKQLLRHKIVIALDDRGKISCHKVNLCFLYMDSAPCIAHLQTSIEQQERDPASGWEQRMDVTSHDIVIQGSRTTRLSRKQERATLLYLRYISRWGRDRVRGRLVSPPAAGGRHCSSLTCPCQFIEEHLHCKPSEPVKLLGVTLDTSLNWVHVDNLCSSLSAQQFAMRQLRPCLNDAAMRTVYFAMVHSLISYAIVLWGNSTKPYKVFNMQKAALRIIGSAPYGAHCKPLFLKYKILAMPRIYIFETLILIHKKLSDLNSHTDVHNYNTRYADNLIIFYSRICASERNKLDFHNFHKDQCQNNAVQRV